jgi:hypothetical protein
MHRRLFIASAVGATVTAAATMRAATSQGATPPCRATAAPGGLTGDDFRNYIAAFNRHDFAGFGKYYATDVIFEGRGGNFRGREQVLDFYRGVQPRLRETITVNDLIVGAEGMLADLETQLYALTDWPDFATGPIHKNETIRSQNFIWYEIKNGQFVHIRSAHYRKL